MNRKFDIESVINELLIGKRIIYTDIEWAPALICRGFTGEEKLFSDIRYKEALDEARTLGIMTEKELLKQLQENEVWTKAHEMQIIATSTKIKKLGKQMIGLKWKLAQKRNKIQQIKDLKEKKKNLQTKKSSLTYNCAERFAEEKKYHWHIHKVILNLEGIPLWKTYDDYLNTNREDVLCIIYSYIDQFNLSIPQIRSIARSPTWRVYWKSCQNSRDLFNKPMCDLDQNQILLIYWSRIYDSAYEAYEPPDTRTVNSDELFYAWLDEQSKEVKKSRANRKASKKGGKTGANVKQESFVMTDEEGAKEFYEEVQND